MVEAHVAEATGPSTGRRLANLDVLRAVAALLVLVGHAYALGGRGLPVVPSHWYQAILIQGTSGVWLFFVLSGYLIGGPFVRALVNGTPLPPTRAYAIKRGFRIYPLYWVSLAIVLVFVGAGETHSWQYVVHAALLQDLVPGRAEAIIAVAWTLTLEVLFYATVPILAHAVRALRPGPIPAPTLASWVVASWVVSGAFLVGGSLVTGTNGVWLRQLLPAMWGMFCPGLLLVLSGMPLDGSRWRYWLQDVPANRNMAWAIAVAALLGGAVLASIATLEWGERTASLVYSSSRPLFALGFGFVVFRALRAPAWHERFGSWLLQLGLISYGIYLLHAVIVYCLSTPGGSRFIPLHHGGAVAGAVHVTYVVALTIPAALVSWHVLERPLIAFSHRLASEHEPSTPALAPAAAT
jgi:peptidoglycan/LPS O-acetylase OafA/YrhL